jgi:hypothetical protein
MSRKSEFLGSQPNMKRKQTVDNARVISEDESSIRVIQVNGPLGMHLQQFKIRTMILLKLAKEMGVKKKNLSRIEKLRNIIKKKSNKNNKEDHHHSHDQEWLGPPLGHNMLVIPRHIT